MPGPKSRGLAPLRNIYLSIIQEPAHVNAIEMVTRDSNWPDGDVGHQINVSNKNFNQPTKGGLLSPPSFFLGFPSPSSFAMPGPQLDPQLAVLLDVVNAAVARNSGATVAQHGATRTHDEINDDDDDEGLESVLPQSTPMQMVSPFTLEEGRAYKKHKNLSVQSDTDCDTFLKVSSLSQREEKDHTDRYIESCNPIEHQFMLYTATVQCRDMLAMLISDNQKKYKVPDTLKVRSLQDIAY